RTITRTASATRTATPTNKPTVTRTVTSTGSPTRTGTATWTPSITRTPTVTRTPTIVRTPSPTGRPGADITYVGLARANDTVITPVGTTDEGWPIYQRPIGFAFNVVVEARPGPSRRPVGLKAVRYSPEDAAVRTDLENILPRALGDGSAAVCDDMLPDLGGIPASLSFDE